MERWSDGVMEGSDGGGGVDPMVMVTCTVVMSSVREGWSSVLQRQFGHNTSERTPISTKC